MVRSFAFMTLTGALLVLANMGGTAFSQDAAAPTETPAAAATAEGETPAVEEAPAEEAPPTPEQLIANLTVGLDTVWVIVCGMLVFFMNAGFGCVEAGFCRAKNCVNILSKNFVVFAVSTLGFWLVGWGLMFGNGTPYYGTEGLWMVGGTDNSPAISDYAGAYSSIGWAGVPLWAKFFFQLVFAGTAATIVSGAVAERIKYVDFIIFTFIMAVAIYPVTGHWIWGGGWLAGMGMFDFAGSTVVHSVGGWAALTGAIILGPRIGKYSSEGKVNAIPGHSMLAAFIGCMILWLGWFGFNPGSTMGVGDGSLLAEVAVTTNCAAAAGTLAATLTSWVLLGKPDIGMTLNGCLAGLVAITAPCAFVTVGASLIIGAIGGALVVVSVMAFDRAKVDDPVGATSVHLVNGIWGTLCVGLFTYPEYLGRGAGLKAGLFYGGGMDQLVVQLIGVAAVGAYVLVVSSVVWLALKFTIGLRVKPEEEVGGLDIGEHGNEAYPSFVMQAGR